MHEAHTGSTGDSRRPSIADDHYAARFALQAWDRTHRHGPARTAALRRAASLRRVLEAAGQIEDRLYCRMNRELQAAVFDGFKTDAEDIITACCDVMRERLFTLFMDRLDQVIDNEESHAGTRN